MYLTLATLAATLAVAAAPAAAGAATTTSSNWAGYAVRPNSSRTSFRRVAASWVVPQGTCDANSTGYSATWVGLGGFRHGSRGLEQTGTEFDCGRGGKPAYSAWYELLPKPASQVPITVRAGDAIDAAVTVNGQRVTLILRNRTLGKTFKRTLTVSAPDTTSAEWIVEAPSACDASGASCAELPLSNFGSESLVKASATTQSGHKGTIGDSGWSTTKIVMHQTAIDPRFAAVAVARGATPSELSGDGSSFSVSYQQEAQPLPGPPTQFPGGADPGPVFPTG